MRVTISRRKTALRFALGVFATFASPITGNADEDWRTTAVSGTWAAEEHHPSQIAPTDACVAAETSSGVMLRSGKSGVELRILDEDWSLPTGIHGEVVLTIAAFRLAKPITANTSNIIAVRLEADEVDSLFVAMDKGTSMDLAIGKQKKLVSLIGSTKVTNAFRTCAGLHGAAPGNNPFQ